MVVEDVNIKIWDKRKHSSADSIKSLPSKLQVAAFPTRAVEAGQQHHNLEKSQGPNSDVKKNENKMEPSKTDMPALFVTYDQKSTS